MCPWTLVLARRQLLGAGDWAGLGLGLNPSLLLFVFANNNHAQVDSIKALLLFVFVCQYNNAQVDSIKAGLNPSPLLRTQLEELTMFSEAHAR